MKFSQLLEASSVEELRRVIAELNALLNPTTIAVRKTELDLAPVVPQAPEFLAKMADEAAQTKAKRSGRKPPVVAPPKEEVEEKSTISAASLKEEIKAEKQAAEAKPAEDVEADPFVEVDPFAESAPEAKKYTFSEINDFFKRVNAKHDMAKVKEILKPFNAERVSAVKEADYPKVVALCQAALA